MSHVDEGLIHAWIEDQLPADEAARVERLVATDPAWGAAAAEARGLIAGSSRILGALDSVPSAQTGVATDRTKWTGRTHASWVRSPWLRAAAAVVLVVGVSGLLFRGNEVQLANDAAPAEELAQPKQTSAPAVVAQQTPPAVPAAAPSPTAQKAQGPLNEASRIAVSRNGATSNDATHEKRAEVAAVSPPVVASPPPVAAAPPLRDEVRAGVASGVIDSSAGRAGVSTGPGSGAGVGAVAGGGGGRGGGGRGGRGGAGSTGVAVEQTRAFAQAAGLAAQKSDADRSDAAKTAGASRVDSILNSCWLQLDPATAARQAAESARSSVVVLRFVPPVITDLVAPAPVTVMRPTSPPAANMAAPLRALPATARPQNTTPHVKDDSTLVAEWVDADGRRTQLTFRVRGDTLRGAATTNIGDRANTGPAFVAVRALCPQ